LIYAQSGSPEYELCQKKSSEILGVKMEIPKKKVIRKFRPRKFLRPPKLGAKSAPMGVGPIYWANVMYVCNYAYMYCTYACVIVYVEASLCMHIIIKGR